MNIPELQTPSVLLDLDVAETNLKRYHTSALKAGKQVWPMVKTHKSLYLARLQALTGCSGFLCGTLDEAEMLANAGFQNIMYAYPVSTKESIARVIALARKCNFMIRLDSVEAAKNINQFLEEADVKLNYTIIIDSGLHRFGIAPSKITEFLKETYQYKNLVWKGISTHPGHVYSAQLPEEVSKYVKYEIDAIHLAVDKLREAGYDPEIVSTGSTPTFWGELEDSYINVLHPGNYIFHDYIQMSLGIACEKECALTVLASVISNPSEDKLICDAGAKCLGLDKGAHGNAAITGHGYVIQHPEITVSGLSEEVGKLQINGCTDLKIGDKIQIIPNHSCSSANLTDYFIGVRNGKAEGIIYVDARGNRKVSEFPILKLL